MHFQTAEGGDEADRQEQLAYVAALSEGSLQRQSRGMLASEKMRGPVYWTYAQQRDAMTLFELYHDVVAYEAWPMEVSVRVGRETFPYHPSLGLQLSSGRKVAVDIVGRRDEGTPLRAAFDKSLDEALARVGVGFISLWASSLRADGRLPVARGVMRAIGSSVDGASEFACTRHVAELRRPVSLGELGAIGPTVARTACVLAMRRTLAIDLRPSSLDDCLVRLPSQVAA